MERDGFETGDWKGRRKRARERAREKVGKKEGKGIGKKVLGWENTRLNVNANDPFAIKAPRLLDLSQLFAFVPFYYS